MSRLAKHRANTRTYAILTSRTGWLPLPADPQRQWRMSDRIGDHQRRRDAPWLPSGQWPGCPCSATTASYIKLFSVCGVAHQVLKYRSALPRCAATRGAPAQSGEGAAMRHHLPCVRAAVTLVSVLGLCLLSGVTLALPATAWAGETAPGSTETLTVTAPNERGGGEPMTVTVEGTADGLHRLFVYGEDPWEGGCETWPYQEQRLKDVVTLTGAEGDPLDAGPFSRNFAVMLPAGASAYTVCAYLDATVSGNPDVFQYGCFDVP